MLTDPLVFIIVGAIILGFAAWAGWNVGGWRRDRPHILPDQVWLCDGCRSFNDPTHLTCYACHRPRALDARVVEPDAEFHLVQQLGRSKTSVSWGASSPWLAGEEPLSDAWAAERARASEAALAGSAPDTEFWAAPPENAAPESAAPLSAPPAPESKPSSGERA